MRAISAVDSVSLAIQRTREFPLQAIHLGNLSEARPGRDHHGRPGQQFQLLVALGRWKSIDGHSPLGHPAARFHRRAWLTPDVIAAIVAAVLVVILLSIVIFYLVTRLRFAYFHCLIHNTKGFGPAGGSIGAQAMRFFWLNIGVGLGFLVR